METLQLDLNEYKFIGIVHEKINSSRNGLLPGVPESFLSLTI